MHSREYRPDDADAPRVTTLSIDLWYRPCNNFTTRRPTLLDDNENLARAHFWFCGHRFRSCMCTEKPRCAYASSRACASYHSSGANSARTAAGGECGSSARPSHDRPAGDKSRLSVRGPAHPVEGFELHFWISRKRRCRTDDQRRRHSGVAERCVHGMARQSTRRSAAIRPRCSSGL